MGLQVEEDHPSIVVLGGFDPRRFQPLWFRAQKLLGAEEAEQAEPKVIIPEVAEWSTEWLDVQVIQSRLMFRAKVASRAESLRDLALGTLQLLDQTVATALGMNRTMHFTVGGEEAWHRIGDTLAPKEPWAPHLRKRPGMRALQIEETSRADGLPGKQVVTIQPSLKYAHGVLFDVNNEITSTDGAGTGFFMDVIRDHWSRVLTEAKAMAEGVLAHASGEIS